ncbi:MAG: ATP-binding protein, partial [Candidatus Limnocylindrales bacterium]
MSRLEAALDRLDLLICAELGFVRLDPDQSQLLFTLLAHRYTRGALIVTSNLEFADWTTVFAGDERLTAALLDRLTHRCPWGSEIRIRSRGESVVLVDEAAEQVPSANVSGTYRHRVRGVGERGREGEPTMRPP